MCGIAGIVQSDREHPVSRADLERMAGVIRHRGPDAEGFLERPGAGFAFRRLSIIDRGGGDQPIYNENGRVGIVFNGEIYNFRELREQLVARGHTFRTQADTESILHGYEEWGIRGVCERLRGMFAFAIHDAERGRVVLARDRLGIKPLHLAAVEGEIWFASELKSFLSLERFPRRISPEALLEYATLGYVPAPRCIFSAVEKVPPGHLVRVEGGRARQECYWSPQFGNVTRDLESASARILELLDDAVRTRLVAEVPLGCFLSGGLDSSAVVASMVEQVGTSLNAVTVGFDVKEFDERDAARRVAKHLGITPLEEEVRIDPGALDRVSDCFDEPHADPSDVPTWLLCQAAKRRVTVALSGDGGDELFGGYRRYAFDLAENRIRSLIPRAVRRSLFGPLGRVLPKADWLPRPLRAKTLVENLALDPVEAYFRSVARVAPEEVCRLVDPEFLDQAAGYRPLDRFLDLDRQHGLGHPLLRIRALDLKTWLPDDILTKVDRASMAHSLEVRVPILDHHLVEFAAGLDPALLIRGATGKIVFKNSQRRRLPDETIDRRKQGFDLPVEAWFRGALSAELDRLARAGSALEGTFRLERARELLAEHRSGRRNRQGELWMLLCFARWRERFGAP
ncbi:MAG: asparagine synthase (glutamine-hydrolyzing) [Planctomycetota bacterium]